MERYYTRTQEGAYQFWNDNKCTLEAPHIALLYAFQGDMVLLLKHGSIDAVESHAKTLSGSPFVVVSGNSFHPVVLNHAINCSGYIPYWLDGYQTNTGEILKSSNYLPPNPDGLFRVIVAGSRGFNDYEFIKKKLDELLKNKFPYVEIVNGLAAGPDTLGGQWAEERKVAQKKFPADWKNEPRRAGILRNMQMGDYAQALIAFWDGKSRGTKHMIEYAKSKGLSIKVVQVPV